MTIFCKIPRLNRRIIFFHYIFMFSHIMQKLNVIWYALIFHRSQIIVVILLMKLLKIILVMRLSTIWISGMKALIGWRVGQQCTRFLHRLRTSIPLEVFKRGTYVNRYTIVVYISSFLGKKATILRIRPFRSNNLVYLLLFTCNNHSVITKTRPVKGSRSTVWQIQGVSKSFLSMLHTYW